MYKPSEEKKDYKCTTCEAQWTQLEVLDKFGPMGFECHRCGAVLEMMVRAEGAETGHAMQSRLMTQLGVLLKLLQQVDSEDIPSNDFERAYSNLVPVPRDETFNPGSRPTVPIDGPNGRPTAVKGMIQVAAAPLNVSVTTSSEKTAAEKAAEAEEKARLAKQNALPDWHVKSTVTGESIVVGRKESDQQVNGASLVKDEEDEKKDSIALNDELAAYYAQLAKEKAQEAKEEQEADDSSGDEEEEDFEDVGIGESGVRTPSSSMSAPRDSQVNGNARPKAAVSGSSGATSKVATPADTGAAAEEEGPVAKKVKFDTQEDDTQATNGTGVSQSLPADKLEKDSDEDEEAEFEDAL